MTMRSGLGIFAHPPASAGYLSTVLGDNPYALWPFNDSGVTLSDYTNCAELTGRIVQIQGANYQLRGAGNDVLFSQTPLVSSEPTLTSIEFGGYTDNQGTHSKYVGVNRWPNQIVKFPCSFEAVIELDSLTGHQTFFGYIDQASGYGLAPLYVKASSAGDGKPCIVISADTQTGTAATSSTAITIGIPHHIVGTHDGNNLNIYVDGILKGSTPCTTQFPDNSQNYLVMGCGFFRNSQSDFLQGRGAMFAFYNYALTAQQVAAHAAAMAA